MVFCYIWDIFDIWGLGNQAPNPRGTRPDQHSPGHRGGAAAPPVTGCFGIQLAPLIGEPNWGKPETWTDKSQTIRTPHNEYETHQSECNTAQNE